MPTPTTVDPIAIPAISRALCPDDFLLSGVVDELDLSVNEVFVVEVLMQTLQTTINIKEHDTYA